MMPDRTDRPRNGTGVVLRLIQRLAVVLTVVAFPTGRAISADWEALQWLPVGERITAFRMISDGGDERYFTPQGGTVIVVWASWSPASLDALRDILPVAQQEGMRWTIVPLNVDDAIVSATRRKEIGALLRAETGYSGTVWFDPGLAAFDDWGVVAVPTVMITDAGGRLVVAERGWSARARARIMGYMGVSGYTPVMADTLRLRWGGRLGDVMQRWRRGLPGRTLRELGLIRSRCRDWAAPVVFAAFWCWQVGDTSCAFQAAERALAADSTNPWAHTALATVELHLQDYRGAARSAEQAVTLDSSFAPAWRLVAELAALEGRESDSEDALAVLRRLNDHDPAADAIAAMLSQRRGATDSALTQWRRALERQLY